MKELTYTVSQTAPNHGIHSKLRKQHPEPQNNSHIQVTRNRHAHSIVYFPKNCCPAS